MSMVTRWPLALAFLLLLFYHCHYQCQCHCDCDCDCHCHYHYLCHYCHYRRTEASSWVWNGSVVTEIFSVPFFTSHYFLSGFFRWRDSYGNITGMVIYQVFFTTCQILIIIFVIIVIIPEWIYYADIIVPTSLQFVLLNWNCLLNLNICVSIIFL